MNKYIQQGADTLRPCPKCGHIPHRVDYVFMGWDDGYSYECKHCGHRAESGYTMPEAVAQWNFEALAREQQIEGRQIDYATGTDNFDK